MVVRETHRFSRLSFSPAGNGLGRRLPLSENRACARRAGNQNVYAVADYQWRRNYVKAGSLLAHAQNTDPEYRGWNQGGGEIASITVPLWWFNSD